VVASLQHFRHYLLGANVVLRTDHHSLKWLRSFKRPEGILARWIETLAEFNYEVEHRPGRLRCNADAVSRPFCKQCFDKPQRIPWVDELQRADSITEPWSIQAIDILPEVSDDVLRQLQDDEPSIGPIKDMIAQGEAHTIDTLRSLPLEARKIWSLRPTVVIQNNLLVRKDEDRTQLVVPTSLRKRLFSHVHGGPLAVHLGSQRTLAQLKQLYYWPGMGKDVENWYKQCQDCATSKGNPNRPHGKLTKVITGDPMDIVAIDILSGLPLPVTK